MSHLTRDSDSPPIEEESVILQRLFIPSSSNMDRISKEKMLEWLTTTVAPKERAMINNGSFNRIADYRVTQVWRQIDQPSLGELGKLPTELLCMVFAHLSCNDLEALRFCSTGANSAILAFPLYRTLCKHAPAIITILKKTRLARSFSIAKIYETFVSTRCTTCDQFGGYVFLPSFSRCCLYCAETLLKFLPISRDSAKKEFGVKERKILESLPQLSTIQGCYSSSYGDAKFYRQHLILFSRELVEKMSDPRDTSLVRYGEGHVSDNTIKVYQRHMALTPLPCFISKSASTEKGVYCTGCALRAKEHPACYGLGRGHSHFDGIRNTITKAEDIHCWMGRIQENCILYTARDRLYDSRHVYSHLQDCAAAQALLKYRWTELQKEISRTDT